MQNVSLNWIRPGTENSAKGSVKKHVDSIQHIGGAEKFKIDLGTDKYKENVVHNTSIGKSLIKPNSDNKEELRLRINTMQSF